MPGLEAKAFNFRAMVELIKERGWSDTVRPSLSPEARRMFDAPPPASVWVDGLLVTELAAAVQQHYGRAASHDFSRDAIRRGAGRFARPIVEGALRLFGASPATLLTRITTLVAQAARGVEVRYESSGPRSGRILARVDDPRPIPDAYVVGLVAGIEDVFEMTRTTPTLGPPRVVASPGSTEISFDVRW